ncbi:hypothetical protein PR048_010073 [Dryococelus australis]|uniref:Uncharacterized protein n=1 Tax=Dryococelus australis TaxID=614101 RepID=A0ABQ9I1P7_9NEOP|nr:hypothetical protein PR048_010073 [Dryococelus australis]
MEWCCNARRGKREYPGKTRRQAASSSTVPTCENPGRRGEEPTGYGTRIAMTLAQDQVRQHTSCNIGFSEHDSRGSSKLVGRERVLGHEACGCSYVSCDCSWRGLVTTRDAGREGLVTMLPARRVDTGSLHPPSTDAISAPTFRYYHRPLTTHNSQHDTWCTRAELQTTWPCALSTCQGLVRQSGPIDHPGRRPTILGHSSVNCINLSVSNMVSKTYTKLRNRRKTGPAGRDSVHARIEMRVFLSPVQPSCVPVFLSTGDVVLPHPAGTGCKGWCYLSHLKSPPRGTCQTGPGRTETHERMFGEERSRTDDECLQRPAVFLNDPVFLSMMSTRACDISAQLCSHRFSDSRLFNGRGGVLASHVGEPVWITARYLPDFRTWESNRTMSLVGGFSRDYLWFRSVLASWRCCILTSLLSSQDLAVNSHPNIFTLSSLTSLHPLGSQDLNVEEPPKSLLVGKWEVGHKGVWYRSQEPTGCHFVTSQSAILDDIDLNHDIYPCPSHQRRRVASEQLAPSEPTSTTVVGKWSTKGTCLLHTGERSCVTEISGELGIFSAYNQRSMSAPTPRGISRKDSDNGDTPHCEALSKAMHHAIDPHCKNVFSGNQPLPLKCRVRFRMIVLSTEGAAQPLLSIQGLPVPIALHQPRIVKSPFAKLTLCVYECMCIALAAVKLRHSL